MRLDVWLCEAIARCGGVMRRIRHPLTFLSAMIMVGCTAIEPVPAWDRGYLADGAMQWQLSPREALLRQHIHASKEASLDSDGAAGGGCGCN